MANRRDARAPYFEPERPRKGAKGKKTNKRRGMSLLQRFLLTLFSLIIVLVLLAFGLIWLKLGGIDRIGDEYRVDASQDSFDVDSSAGEDTLSDEDVQFQDGEAVQDDRVINVLLIGRDDRKGDGRGRSDSMIVVSLNRDTEQISMVSLMRDSYVQIPGYSNNKLNSAFSKGGYSLLNETIEVNYGITIDYNVGVNFDGFQEVVDLLGGVEIELTKAECRYLMNDIYIDAGRLEPGLNRLNGETALCYARARYVSTGTESNDFGRTYRQRMVLTAVYKEMMKKPLNQIWTILDSVIDCIETDMTNGEIIALITEFYNMGIDDLQSYRLPMDDQYTDQTINGMAVLVLDWDEVRHSLQDWLYPQG